MKNRIVSLLLVAVMVLSYIPVSALTAFAASNYDNPTLIVESKYSADNTSVDVSISIANNPGVAGAKIKITYDNRLTLIAATNGTAFEILDYTAPALINPCYLNWDSLDQVSTDDGIIAVLSFNVTEGITPGEELLIKCSYESGDIYDTNLHDLSFDVVDGIVTIIDYIPGDANNDGTINGKDVTLIRRYNAGYTVEINESAANVNGDDVINGKDVTLIRRYNAGYDVELLPAPVKHTHVMESTAAKQATCTQNGNIAYWHCTNCDKYFSDENGIAEITLDNTVISATGHTIVIDPAVEPTYTETGLTEGSHCSVCNIKIVEQTILPILPKEEYSINYNIAHNDAYLASIDLNNQISDSARTYTSEVGLYELPILETDGYDFVGWFDGSS